MAQDKAPPVGTPYEGPSGIFKDTMWLTAESLVEGKDVQVKIADVLLYKTVTFEGGREKHSMGGLRFVGKEKILLLNATNRKTLNKMFGLNTKSWKGETITLYVADAQFGGETVKAVRIRNQRSRVATAAEDFLAGDDEPATGDEDSGATTPEPGAGPAVASDEEAFGAFMRLAHRVTDSFGGERPFLKETPKKSGAIWTCDPDLADPAVQVYLGTEKRLTVTRERLGELTARLEGMLR